MMQHAVNASTTLVDDNGRGPVLRSDSGRSIDLQALAEDHAAPPETTRPEPVAVVVDRTGDHRSAWSQASFHKAGDTPSVAARAAVSGVGGAVPSLAAIMLEQQREQNRRRDCSPSSGGAAAHEDAAARAVHEEEELLLQMALQRSLADLPPADAEPTAVDPLDTAVPVLDPLLAAVSGDEEASMSDGGNHLLLAGALAQLSPEDAAAVAAALQDADREEERRRQEQEQQSLRLAMELQRRESEALLQSSSQQAPSHQPQGHVRVMTRQALAAEGRVGAYSSTAPAPRHPFEEQEEVSRLAAGFRMNASVGQEWNRRGDLVVGPERQLRTKHDIGLDQMANAHRLGLDADVSNIGNKAFNSFKASVKKKTVKGVAAHGTGRAGSDVDATKNGVLDPNVRLLINQAINSGVIERCHGVVKEGKEAVICHADMGERDEFYDVAVKVFKRITEFKSRADYVQGDSRYARENFRKISSREQLNMWAEKEYRNLIRANRAGIPVPTPLCYKENILFMRFLGSDGWPAPQLRELNLRRTSKRWEILYQQIMQAMRMLYQRARLVHADLSEYNIMVVPAYLVENVADNIQDPQEDLQAVLIDFGQAVEVTHPQAQEFLERDIARINKFFSGQGVSVMENDAVLSSVMHQEVKGDDSDRPRNYYLQESNGIDSDIGVEESSSTGEQGC